MAASSIPAPTLEPAEITTVLCDLDGVVWLAHQPIDGSIDAVARLRAAGRRVLFVTNNSSAPVAAQEAALADIGIPAHGDVVTSAMAGASLVRSGERVLVAGGPGVAEAVRARGAEAILNDGVHDPGTVDAVIVGLHRDFDYQRLRAAATAVIRGARLIGTNDDATYPTPRGPEPGGGSILAAVSTVAGVEPTIGGKPHQPMADVITELLGDADTPFDAHGSLMVGDRPETDGRFAARLGCPFALVRSGVLGAGEARPRGVDIALDVADLAAVAAAIVT